MSMELCVMAGTLGLLGILRRGFSMYCDHKTSQRASAYMWSNIVHMK